MTQLGPDEVRERLAAVCARHLGGAGSIENLRHLTGGASQETWSFDFASAAGSLLPLILRRNVRSQFNNLASATEFA